MGRHSKTVIEYRSYEFPPHFPLRVIAGEEWRISDVPSGVLHFHNCLEIGICESDSGKMNFSGKVVPFCRTAACWPRYCMAGAAFFPLPTTPRWQIMSR